MGLGISIVQASELRGSKLYGPRTRWKDGTEPGAHGRLGHGDIIWSNHPGETPEDMDARLLAGGCTLFDDLDQYRAAVEAE